MLFSIFFVDYMLAWVVILLQVLVSPPEMRIWPSTNPLPFEYLHTPAIYLSGLIFQGASNLLLVFLDGALDTYGASLLNLLSGHIAVLGTRLENIDHLSSNRLHLVDCCKRYILILRYLCKTKKLQLSKIICFHLRRYAEIVENILSFAFLAQFGASGLMLCICVYQLSAVCLTMNYQQKYDISFCVLFDS